MPGLNRTGPFGDGPKTGRGLGRCNPDNKDIEFSAAEVAGLGRSHLFRGGGTGKGPGRRMGRGMGPGAGRGMGPGAGRRGRPGRGRGRA